MRVTQVHGGSVRVLARGDVARGAALERPEADALASNLPGLTLAVVVADCVPILLADPESCAAAAVHAGWRGTMAKVSGAAVAALGQLGADPRNVVAAIGPSIGPMDYEVGDAVARAFLDAGHAAADVDRWFRRVQGRLWLDLWTANRDHLLRAGLRAEAIHLCELSTLPHPGVFESYRRDREGAGRMAALIAVPARP